MAMPLDIRDLVSSGAKLREERERPIRIAVFIDVEAPEDGVDALRDALYPQMGSAALHVEPVTPGTIFHIEEATDLVVALAGPGDTLASTLARARERFVPTVVLALGADRGDVAHRLSHPLLDTIDAENADDLVGALGKWIAERVSGKRLAFAANFPFVRRAVAEESIKNTAFQNAVIGGVVILPGADMPLMTANQAKMLLQIAAAYGQPLGAERIKELAAVVGGAFVFRTIARQAVAFIPGFGWAIKAGIGYSGTIAMGYAALEYFEEGGDVKGLAERIRQARDRVVSSAKRDRGSEPIPASAHVVEPEAAAEPVAALPPDQGVFDLPIDTDGGRP